MRLTFDALARDLRTSMRNLRRRPGWTATAIGTLALGIGAVIALSTVVRIALLSPLPFPAPDRMMVVEHRIGGEEHGGNPVRLADLSTGAARVASVGGWYTEGAVWLREGEGAEPERLRALRIYGDFLEALATTPVAGRSLSRAEVAPDSRALMLTERFWRSRLGADPAAVGRSLRIGGNLYAIVGVLPRGVGDTFHADLVFAGPDVASRKAGFLGVVARLREGVSLPSARATFSTLATRMARDHAESDAGLDLALLPAADHLAGTPLSGRLWMVLATAGFVLLIVCVNLACLLLARSPQAIREGSIRAALGAGRGRLLAAALSESLLLALLGGAAGVALAVPLVRLLAARLPADLPNVLLLGEAGLDGATVALALGLALLTGLLVGALPAWRVARRSSFAGLRGRTAGDREGGILRSGLVVVELALSLVLLIGAGLTAQTLLRLQAVPLGFSPERLLALRIAFPWDTDPEKLNATYRDLIQELGAIPGARSAAFADRLPFEGESQGGELGLPGRTFAEGAKTLQISRRAVSAGYFETVGTPLLAGSPLRKESGGQEAVVNRAFARRFFPEGAVGQSLTLDGHPYRIAGVVGDLRQETTQKAPPPEVFTVYEDTHWAIGNFVVRASGRPEDLAGEARAAVRRVAPGQVIDELRTMDASLDEAYAAPRTTASLAGGFSLVALLLAALGLYGVLAADVEARRRELGVRMALGATPRQILYRSILRGALLAALGIAFGFGGGLALRRAIAGLLFESGARDVAPFFLSALVLFAVALLAADGPARRASRVDPSEALRAE